MAKNPADRYATCGDLTAAAHTALAAPDQDRATDILARSQVARLPAVPAGAPPVRTNAGGAAPPWGQPPRASRKPWLWVGVAGTVAAAVVGVALVVVHPWRSSSPPAAPETSRPPTPPLDAVALRVLDDGVFVGSSLAPTTIDVFNEPICPPCGAFIRSNAGGIDAAVNNKKLAVRYHLLDFLDDKSHSGNYSTRAVAASYCVAAQND